jgi:hypothetical protein
MKTRHHLNLTNGLEAAPALVAVGGSLAFLRLQSTTIEHEDWGALLGAEVSDDILMHLALGWRCVIHDRGTRRPLSKTIYFAVPLVRYVLNRRWYGLAPSEVILQGGRGGSGEDAMELFASIYDRFFMRAQEDKGRVKKRVDYFRRYLVGGSCGVNLEGDSVSTDHDGDRVLYARLAHETLT